jgi:cytochrome c553
MRRQNVSLIGGLALVMLSKVACGNATALQEFNSVIHSTPDPAHGQQLFDTCAACHGSNGAGANDGTVPAIGGQHFRVIAGELVDFRHDRRRDERMQNFTDSHHIDGAQDIADLAAYVSRMPVAPMSRGRVDGENLAHGSDIYSRQCASCHGSKAEGDNLKRYPRLAGQHYEYLLDQLHKVAQGRRPDSRSTHMHLLQGFKQSDYTGVADYLSRLGP